MTDLLQPRSMTPSLKTVSWAATNQYAAKCPNWRRDCGNGTPPPAQVGLLWLIHSLLWFFLLHFRDERRISLLALNLSDSFYFHLSVYGCFSCLHRQLFELQRCLLGAEEKGKTCDIIGDKFSLQLVFFIGSLSFFDVSRCCRGTAVTVATASVRDAVPSRCWDLAWVQQVQQATNHWAISSQNF